VDLALRIGNLPDSGLIATHLGNLRRVVCASSAYLSKRGTPGRVQDLTAHDCVSFDLLSAGATWRFQVDDAEIAVPIRPRLTVSTAEAAVDAAIAGLGVTRVLSYQIESAFRAGALSLILEAFEPAPIPVSFVYASQGRLPLKLRALLDFSAPRLRTRLQTTEAALKPVRRPNRSTRIAKKRR
jgi:DNA-binding transcriptional LysR family regulator